MIPMESKMLLLKSILAWESKYMYLQYCNIGPWLPWKVNGCHGKALVSMEVIGCHKK
jgi:hypothetical protein